MRLAVEKLPTYNPVTITSYTVAADPVIGGSHIT